MVKKQKQKRSRYSGTAIVEAAIVFPLLLLLTLGIIEYGWLFLKAQQITNAARQAARIAVRLDASEPEVLAAIDSLMTAAGLPDYNATISPVNIPDGRPAIAIQIEVQCANIVLINAPLFLPTPTSLRGAVTMAKEGA